VHAGEGEQAGGGALTRRLEMRDSCVRPFRDELRALFGMFHSARVSRRRTAAKKGVCLARVTEYRQVLWFRVWMRGLGFMADGYGYGVRIRIRWRGKMDWRCRATWIMSDTELVARKEQYTHAPIQRRATHRTAKLYISTSRISYLRRRNIQRPASPHISRIRTP
jgi:hypothetical protein